MNENIQLKNRLKVARAEKNLSQEQLAALAGVTRQTISSIETGQYCPTAKLALILAKVLNKHFEELFYLEEVTDNEQKNG
ncbi:MAG TPA: helix-turn-helix transcriptional regulator [Desulfitobacteriaceae bacterium]|nr:helix-turn-helix transcriptional regulator [Desulfitobacteriaceae bacterium]